MYKNLHLIVDKKDLLMEDKMNKDKEVLLLIMFHVLNLNLNKLVHHLKVKHQE